MNYTQNYQLPQWEKDDRIMMDDFNDAMSKVENGLGTIPRIITGSYTGNDEMSRKIDLGVMPRAVLLVQQSGWSLSGSASTGGVATPESPVYYNNAITMEIVEGGFQVYRGKRIDTYYSVDCNNRACTYHYIAII